MSSRSIALKTDSIINESSNWLTRFSSMTHSLPDTSKVVRALNYADAAIFTYGLVKSAWDFWDEHRPSAKNVRTLIVPEDTITYDKISKMVYVDKSVDSRNDISTSLTVKEGMYDSNVLVSVQDDSYFEDSIEMFGIPIDVAFLPKNSADTSSTTVGEETTSQSTRRSKVSFSSRYVLTFKDVEDRKKFLKEINTTINSEHRKKISRVYRASYGGFVSGIRNLQIREIESVFLKEGQMESLINSIETFQKNESLYTSLGIPWHMGLILHGPPGTGKTSTLTALASHFSMDILIINLRSIGGDDGLAGALEDISSGVLVILEDVDSILATHSREGEDVPTDDDREDVTLGGLLNVLDGQMTPHGCIFGLTTNYLDRLDKAIYREGRVECLEELGYMDNYQLRNLYKHFFKKDPDSTVPTITPDHKITPAMIISVFRNDINDLDKAEENVKEFLNDIVRN